MHCAIPHTTNTLHCLRKRSDRSFTQEDWGNSSRVRIEEAREKALQFPPGGTPEQITKAVKEMNDQIRSVSLAELPAIELGEMDQHMFFGDAIHPNDKGCQRIAELVADYLIEKKLLTKD